MAGINITQGTQSNIATDAIGTVNYQIVKLDRGAAGASSLFTGTLDALTSGSVRMTVGTLTGGTLQNLVGGTINALATGTITNGTVLTQGLHHADAFATVVSTGTNTFGTIKPTVSGSAIYITDLIVSAGSATNVEIGDGTTGASNIMGTLQLAQYGGMVANFQTPLKTSTSGTLVYKQSVGCPLTITALGYVD